MFPGTTGIPLGVGKGGPRSNHASPQGAHTPGREGRTLDRVGALNLSDSEEVPRKYREVGREKAFSGGLRRGFL